MGGEQKRGGKLRISQARDSVQDRAVRVRKAAPGSQQRRKKFPSCCWQLISSCGVVHTLPASRCLPPRSSITSTSSWQGTSVVCWKGQGAGWDPGWAASWFLFFTGCEGAAEDTVRPGSRGNQSPVRCSEPRPGEPAPLSHLSTKLPVTARARPDNAAILPLETRAGRGLELQHDAPGPEEEDKGQLAGIKIKQQQIQRNTPQTKPKSHLSHKNAVPIGPGSLSTLAVGEEIPGSGSPSLQGLLLGGCVCAGRAVVLQQLCHRC